MNNRYYIFYAFNFTYKIDAMRAVLRDYIVNPRESYLFGLNSSPKVLTFKYNMTKFNNEIDAEKFICNLLALKLFEGRTPVIWAKNW